MLDWTRSIWMKWALVMLWAAVIFAFSAWPSLPPVGDALLDLIVKKGAHGVEFGILAWLLLSALQGDGPRPEMRHFGLALAATTLYAISDELHQSLTPGRFPSPNDVGIDVAGALAFLLARARLHRYIAEEA